MLSLRFLEVGPRQTVEDAWRIVSYLPVTRAQLHKAPVHRCGRVILLRFS